MPVADEVATTPIADEDVELAQPRPFPRQRLSSDYYLG